MLHDHQLQHEEQLKRHLELDARKQSYIPSKRVYAGHAEL